MKRFAVADCGQADQLEPIQDLTQLNQLIDSHLNDLSKKLLKSQSTDTIDARAEECIKLISRSTSQTFNKTLRKRLPKVILGGPKSQNQLIPYYLRFAAIVG